MDAKIEKYKIKIKIFDVTELIYNKFISDNLYQGMWFAGKQYGWGCHFMLDGTVYEGDFHEGKRSGNGMEILANGNRYEGGWLNRMKHGAGKFYYLDTGQLLEGIWVKDIAKCGTMTDFNHDEAPYPTQYLIPECKLENPELVMKEAHINFLDAEQIPLPEILIQK